MTDAEFHERYEQYKVLAEQALRASFPENTGTLLPRDGGIPDALLNPMRYSALSGGKRLRPVLTLAACDMAGGDTRDAMPFAAACEIIHASSLILDDLPCMDDDDTRRGQPTCHKAYGEDMAVLAGCAMVFLSAELMAGSAHPRAQEALRCVMRHTGARGIYAGQALDVSCEGQQPTDELVRYIHKHKTADMLTASVLAGLILADADEASLRQGTQYGLHLGLEFQIVDDLLDLTGDEAQMGKRLGKDAEHGKLTWPALKGAQAALQDARSEAEQACAALDGFGQSATFLKRLAQTTLMRVQ